MDGTNPALGGVRVDGTYGSVGLGTPGLVGAVAGKKLTIVITARFLSNATGNFIGSDIAGVATFLAGQTITCQVRTAANALIAGPSTPVAADPLDWNTYFFSFDTTTGIVRSLAAVNDKAASSTSPTADALINIPGVTSLLVNGVGSGPLIGVDIRRIWIAADTWDFTSLTERQKFTVGTAYGTPKDLGGTGAVDGVTPLVDIYGRVGDFIVGRNGGSGGDLYFPNWIDSAHCGLSTPPDAAA
jgi:hypothetical protein